MRGALQLIRRTPQALAQFYIDFNP